MTGLVYDVVRHGIRYVLRRFDHSLRFCPRSSAFSSLRSFRNGTSEALSSVVSNGGLLNKIAVEPEIFPIAAIAANVSSANRLTTFPIIVVLTAVLTHDPIHVALVPVVLIALVARGCRVWTGPLALFVFFRDLSHLWGVISFVFG